MMKKISYLTVLILSITFLFFSCKTSDESTSDKAESISTSDLSDLSDSASYALGVQIAQSFKQQGFAENINQDVFLAALKKQFTSDEELLEMEKANQIIQKFMNESSKSENSEKIEEGEAFLEKNAKREEVKVTDSGLQYEIIEEGSGESPTPQSTVKTHYKGSLLDGTVFDSSYERGEPAEFPVNGVIKGWQEALPMMKTGAKWKLYIPYDLAYGERGSQGVIGPYETLIFEIELIEITKK
ncbi:MAG: FKBP-type peptidyl-prolyl cis-trans isomerase [Bacteroidota bacterium]